MMKVKFYLEIGYNRPLTRTIWYPTTTTDEEIHIDLIDWVKPLTSNVKRRVNFFYIIEDVECEGLWKIKDSKV